MNLLSAQLHEEFLNFMFAEKNASEYTLKNYKDDFRSFTEYLLVSGKTLDIAKCQTKDIRLYISFLKISKKYQSNSIRRKIHSLSSFYRYLCEMEYIQTNPMTPIHAPKREETLPVYLSKSELKRLLEAPFKFARFPEHRLRDRLILELFVFTGARRSEVIRLNWSDINFSQKTILLNGKGKKQRVVPINDILGQDLVEYYSQVNPAQGTPVIISDAGNRISITGLQTLIRRYIIKSGLDGKGYTIHKLRHSFATHLHEAGVDVLTIQTLLGHSDLNSTKIYTHTSVQTLKDSVNKLKIM